MAQELMALNASPAGLLAFWAERQFVCCLLSLNNQPHQVLQWIAADDRALAAPCMPNTGGNSSHCWSQLSWSVRGRHHQMWDHSLQHSTQLRQSQGLIGGTAAHSSA
jgi:hypothetical protein